MIFGEEPPIGVEWFANTSGAQIVLILWAGSFFLGHIIDFFFPQARERRVYRETATDVNFNRQRTTKLAMAIKDPQDDGRNRINRNEK